MEVAVVPVNFDPTANVNPNAAYYSSLLARKRNLGPLTGNGTGTVICQCTTESIGGVKWLGVIDAYCGTTSGSIAPTNNWYFFVGAFGTSNQVSGCSVAISLDVTIDFFEVGTPAG
jgi:hypothetical protein